MFVIVGFATLPSQGVGGPAAHHELDLGLQDVHPVGDSNRVLREWRSLVARVSSSFAVIVAGSVLIAIVS